MKSAVLIGATLLVALIAVLQCWPYSRRWGDGPAYTVGALGFVFLYWLTIGNWED